MQRIQKTRFSAADIKNPEPAKMRKVLFQKRNQVTLGVLLLLEEVISCHDL